jgi:ComF family protein
MKTIPRLLHSTLHLFYPHTCAGCGSDLLPATELLCGQCIVQLPYTHFAASPNNAVERMFTGRLSLLAASSELYFAKAAAVQRLVHQLKYKGGTDIGHYLGRLMGLHLAQAGRFANIDCLVPLPLHPSREKKRGYNQAALLCNGMAEVLQVPVHAHALARQRSTQTQTRKQRMGRWENVDGSFAVADAAVLEGRHILLVDDVVTTGATLDACGNTLLSVPGTALSIATLACALVG